MLSSVLFLIVACLKSVFVFGKKVLFLSQGVLRFVQLELDAPHSPTEPNLRSLWKRPRPTWWGKLKSAAKYFHF